ncbi:MAG: hypothetical protein FJ148_27445, partial [Deltaproteobacteria bacterium]|nr:hypothetical protein [Deltaproteobacteria bacterium]
MTSPRLHVLATAAVAAAFAGSASAQFGRVVVQTAPAVTGQTAAFEMQYPVSLAGTFYMLLFAMPPFGGAVPAPIPGFNVQGLLRIDPASAVIAASGLLDASGRSPSLPIAIPSAAAFVGQQFEVQGLDLTLLTNTITFTDNDVTPTIAAPFTPSATLDLVAIPAGSYTMGSAVFGGIALPLHPVQISRSFWLGRTEVTQAQYTALMGPNPSQYVDPQKPVERVTHAQALAYCAELTRREAAAGRLPAGYVYRLPTEAEWEFACRAGTTSEYHTGSSLICTQANFAACVNQTAVVASYPANARGLRDMHGNVAEWVLDATPGTANYPTGLVVDPIVADGASRLVRGGSWNTAAAQCVSGARRVVAATNATNDVGFRVALAPALPDPALGMVAIQPGSFTMGSATTPPLPFYSGAVERPVHAVTLTSPFWLGKHEVTQARYQALMGSNPSAFVGPDRPVEQVSWQQAMAYCAALTAREAAAGRLPWGYEYRLPTEAEWEYAARAGSTTAFHTGASLTCAQANFFNEAASAACVGQTSNVGSYPPNAWGLHDMHGNVREHCFDLWDTTPTYNAAPVADPIGVRGGQRVDRGGSWSSLSTQCRSAHRNGTLPGLASNQIGFRVALAPALGLPQLVSVAPGTFAMGSTAGSANEAPVRNVTISSAVSYGKYEVTQAQYLAVMGSNPSAFGVSNEVDGWKRPVEQVTHAQATAFCVALTAAEQAAGRLPRAYVYRLPTEAEWERACRAGTMTEWSTGVSLPAGAANFGGALGQTTAVGRYPANALGLHDLHGNVNEWCLDAFANYPAGAVTDPYLTTGSVRVARGGDWSGTSYVCRSAYRDAQSPTVASSERGFRVVMARTAPESALGMVPIAPGTFQMGSTAGQSNEQPVHPVTLSYPFWMGKYEVTQAQYQSVVGSNPSYFQGANAPNAPQRPVEQVSWNSAVAYCQALTATEQAAGRVPAGYQYRLPTEAEWEYCCRAGTTTEWNTGTSLSTSQANFQGALANGTYTSGQTAVVGSYAPNAFGLHDMHGNVWEWCLDSYALYAPGPVTDPFVTGGAFR